MNAQIHRNITGIVLFFWGLFTPPRRLRVVNISVYRRMLTGKAKGGRATVRA